MLGPFAVIPNGSDAVVSDGWRMPSKESVCALGQFLSLATVPSSIITSVLTPRPLRLFEMTVWMRFSPNRSVYLIAP
jgi:hypothetical protein